MMESLFSPQWYRVAELHPCIRQHVRLHRQVIREQIWYLLEDEVSGRQHRLDPIAFGFVGLLNGHYSVDQLWQKQLEKLRDDAPTQHDIVRLVGQLHQADLIQCELPPDVEELFSRQERRQKQRRWGMVNPLSFRTPLLDPDRWINRIYPALSWLFSRSLFFIIVAALLLALLAAGLHWDEISLHASYHFHSSNNWIMMWLIFPLMKLLHETSHALAVRHWGGRVHEMGVTLMLLMPIPYVDASAANLFPERHARMLVSAAGILSEVIMATLALAVWLSISDGTARDIAFLVMTIGGVSTLLFNGNPLLKFDGYHVFADWLQIPNLAWQSKRYWSWLARAYVLRVPHTEAPIHTPAERKWLILYGPASWFYRLGIMLALGSWLIDVSLWLALGVVGLFLYGLLLKPGYEILRYLIASSELAQNRVNTWLKSGVATLALILSLALLPLPYATSALGVVWVPDDARVRTGVDGFVEQILVTNGERVKQGQTIALLQNESLSNQFTQAQLRLAATESRYQSELRTDYVKSTALHEEAKLLRGQLARLQQEVDALTLRAGTDGVVQIVDAADLPGRWLNKGSELAIVLRQQPSRIRVAINQQDAGLINDSNNRIDVRFSEEPGTVYRGELLRGSLTPSNHLPSEALAARAGGDILTHVEADPASLQTLQPVFLLDVEVPQHQASRTGGRVWLRFEHGSKPLLAQWTLRWKQLFLKQFGSMG